MSSQSYLVPFIIIIAIICGPNLYIIHIIYLCSINRLSERGVCYAMELVLSLSYGEHQIDSQKNFLRVLNLNFVMTTLEFYGKIFTHEFKPNFSHSVTFRETGL